MNFIKHITVKPKFNRHNIQQFSYDKVTGFFYMSQNQRVPGKSDNLEVVEYKDGLPGDSMSLPTMGHGQPLIVENVEGKVFLTLYLRPGSKSIYARLPWTPGKVWTPAEVKKLKIDNPGFKTSKPKLFDSYWFQGERSFSVMVDGKKVKRYARAYGTPYRHGKTDRDKDIPGRLEIIQNGKIIKVKDISHIMRKDGLPEGEIVNHRVEIEGVTTVKIDSTLR